MKTILFKILLLLNIIFITGCKAQTTNDYITFYNGIAPKLNSIVSYKTQFYGQPFFSFYNELLNKSTGIVSIGIDSKIANSPKMYVLRLYFAEDKMREVSSNNSFQRPVIWITFQNEIPAQVIDAFKQHHGEWNNNMSQLFSNMIIEKIDFVGINGYDNPDRSSK